MIIRMDKFGVNGDKIEIREKVVVGSAEAKSVACNWLSSTNLHYEDIITFVAKEGYDL